MAKIGIIGSGIIGLSSAYYLQKSGYEVTIIDQGNIDDGCSHGNAGMIVPSHFIPLAAPGMIAKGIRWMFNSSSPFYVRPQLNFDLIKWGIEFYKHSNAAHVQRSATALKEISLLSKAMYQQLAKELTFDFDYHERGLMMLYQTKEVEHEERETAKMANDYGIEAKVLSAEEVQQLEPDVKVNVRGGVLFPGDAHLTPQAFMKGLIKFLKEKITIHSATEVNDFEINHNKITRLKTSKGNFEFDAVVVATGSWSGLLSKKLKMHLPMQAGKGYSFTLPEVSKNIHIPSILLEGRVAVTPMGNSLRFGGTMEITGVDHSINMNRVKGIVKTANDFYPELKVEIPKVANVWHGLRPCSPDGLPYIGRSKKYHNLIFATGHSMLGVSLGPGTGKLISEIVDESKTSMDLKLFDPERFN
ncbi:MAG TPA: amino acid dehydrogenase [Cytophagales bacterium]|jgi:D-amino-acid dehydrogenase|nr:amino acid dehydrogenase [Cytophagales bacterium]